jgi:hypothetical protein
VAFPASISSLITAFTFFAIFTPFVVDVLHLALQIRVLFIAALAGYTALPR